MEGETEITPQPRQKRLSHFECNNFNAPIANISLLQYLNTCFVFDEVNLRRKTHPYYFPAAFSASIDLTSGHWIVAGGETSDENGTRWVNSTANLECGE